MIGQRFFEASNYGSQSVGPRFYITLKRKRKTLNDIRSRAIYHKRIDIQNRRFIICRIAAKSLTVKRSRAADMSPVHVAKPSSEEIVKYPREFAIFSQLPGAKSGAVDAQVRILKSFASLSSRWLWHRLGLLRFTSICDRALSSPVIYEIYTRVWMVYHALWLQLYVAIERDVSSSVGISLAIYVAPQELVLIFPPPLLIRHEVIVIAGSRRGCEDIWFWSGSFRR
jgi:hypothetical protein